MYKVCVKTPLGDFDTVEFPNENLTKMEEFLSTIGEMSHIKFTISSGEPVYMSKGMIDQSLFFLKEIK